MYTYNATVSKIIDGDTIEVVVDLGFHLTSRQRVRILGINTPELFSGTNREAGLEAKTDTFKWCESVLYAVTITTSKADGFGRWLAAVHEHGNAANSLTDHLLSLGYPAYRR